jgi:hypothetical protein
MVLSTIGVTDRAYARPLVPFEASDSGSATVVGGSGSVVQTVDIGSGHGTHLGRYELVGSETVDLASGAITNGHFTITAANGDTITGTYSGEALAGLTGYLVSGPITGGTGRFGGATGFLVWRGTLDPVAFTFTDDISGTVSTTGS